MANKQLGVAPSNANDALRLTDLGTKTKTSALTALAGSSLSLSDKRIVLDVSDTSQGAGGTLKSDTILDDELGVRTLLQNASVARVINGAGASDTYLTGSNIPIPSGYPVVRTKYRCRFDVTKTAAGTATPIVTVRIGTAGTTADAAICQATFGAGTLAIDTAIILIEASFRTVGSGTSAVLVASFSATTNLTTTGWSNAVKAVVRVSSGFNSTTANLIIGTSYNGGTSAVHTVEQVVSELIP
jgi:hypothetical protein